MSGPLTCSNQGIRNIFRQYWFLFSFAVDLAEAEELGAATALKARPQQNGS